MIWIIAESESDSEVVEAIVKQVCGDGGCTVHRKGFSGWPELRKNGADYLNAMLDVGRAPQRLPALIVIVSDADGADRDLKADAIQRQIVGRMSVAVPVCLAVPVRTIESWMLGDPSAVRTILNAASVKEIQNTDVIEDPKAELSRAIQTAGKKRFYSNALHNPRIAKAMKLNVAISRSPSLRLFVECVRQTLGLVA